MTPDPNSTDATISEELRGITDVVVREFPGLVDAVRFDVAEDIGDSAAELIPTRFPGCPLLLIYSNGTYYVGGGRQYSFDSDDEPKGDDPQRWALDIVRRIGEFGMYRVGRKISRKTGGGPLWLPKDEDEFRGVFDDSKALITIESMPWRGLTVKAD